MIKAIILDDEQHCIDRLTTLLETNCKQSVHVMDTYPTIEEALAGIKKLQPDLAFLDVQVGDNTSFDLLQSLGEIHFDIIFTTAYEQYGVKAIKISAIDYLLKPIDADDLVAAVEKLNRKKSREERSNQLEALFDVIKNPHGQSKKINVPTVSGLTILAIEDIIRCQSDVNYTTFFLKDKQKLVVAKTLKEYEELLADHNFYRVHNSHLVNLAYVKSYNKGKGGYVKMQDGSEIEVSTRRKDDFLKRLAQL